MARQAFFKVSLSGEKELAKFFDELPKSLTASAVRNAGKKALVPVIEAAKQNVAAQSERTGTLRKSLIVSTKLSSGQKSRFKRTGLVEVYAGADYKTGRHAHLVEFGTQERWTKKTHPIFGRYRGRGRPEPFLRPAWDSNSATVLKIMRTELWDLLRKGAQRLRKQAVAGKLSRSNTNFFINK